MHPRIEFVAVEEAVAELVRNRFQALTRDLEVVDEERAREASGTRRAARMSMRAAASNALLHRVGVIAAGVSA